MAGDELPKKLYWLVVLCVVVGGLWAHISYYSPTHTFRYRLTLEVGTPDGSKTGSSVVEATYFRELVLEWVFGPRFPSYFKGEAVFVDLGGGRNVVLTVMDSPEFVPCKVYTFPCWKADAYDGMRASIERAEHEGPRNVPFEFLRLMVTFRNKDDPKTLEQVDARNLVATFGPGYTLKAVSIQGTDAPITQDLMKSLPWFQRQWADPKLRYHGLDGSYFGYSAHLFMIGGGYLKRDK